MNKKFYMFFLMVVIMLAGCGNKYDDTDIWNQVNSNKSRIEKLEKEVESINAQITQLKSLLDAIGDGGLTITFVRETASGYMVVFSDGSNIEITNGKDGKDGADAPVIGVKQDANGIYYWTITINGETIWLIDTVGNKIQAIAEPGKDGQDGQDGKDGITPLVSVDDNGYWIISYDGGVTYTFVLDANGNKVLAKIGSGNSSPQLITNIYVSYDYMEITLYNYQVIRIPIDTPMSISFDQTTGINLSDVGSSKTIYFSVEGYSSGTFIETCVHGNLSVILNYNGGSNGSLVIKRTGDIDSFTKVLVFLCNTKKTITYVLTFNEQGGGSDGYEDPRLPQVVPEDILKKLKGHMNIFDGKYPPIIEGSYVMDNPRVVYCEDEGNGGFPAGLTDYFASMYFQFSNQNTKDNTLDYEEIQGNSYSKGEGAYICGNGNNFTAFFNTEGYSGGSIYVKMALVISGTYTSTGINNMQYAFVMVDKKNDYDKELMEVGVFRIFDDNDNFASKTNWPSYAPQTRSWGNATNIFNIYKNK